MSTSASTNIAQRLKQNASEILRRWEASARAAPPAARRKSRPALLNSLPRFLDELARALEVRNDEASAGPMEPGEHVEQRVNLSEYSLEQVVQEYSLLRGAILDVLSASAPIEYPDLRIILDTIDLRIAETSAHYVALQERTLRESEGYKDDFLDMLAHELRNPLASIISSAEFLRLHPSYRPEIEQMRNIIERQGKHLARLVDDLLDVARVTQGKVALRKAPVELNPLVRRVVGTLRPFIEERRQTISISLPDTTIWLEADSTRLTQVLANLVHNSTKFTGPGGHIDLRVSIEHNQVIIQVRDNGIGIAPDLLPHVFDVFIRASHLHDGSLGIGLPLVKSLVEMHGGIVTAHSEGSGKGSEFLIRLPILKLSETAEDKHAAQAGAGRQPSPKRILVVDDNWDAAESIAMLLGLCRHKVSVAHNGREALNAAAAEPPQAVLLDLGLPDMDGYEVARRMRIHPKLKDVRLIALTGYGQEHDRGRSREAGFDAHLIKPADLAALQSAISDHREQKHL